MRTLEMIHVRLAGVGPDALADAVWATLGDSGDDLEIRVYRHVRVENDLLVKIRWEGRERWEQVSEQGLRIASLLRRHGVVEHSVWVEQTQGKPR